MDKRNEGCIISKHTPIRRVYTIGAAEVNANQEKKREAKAGAK